MNVVLGQELENAVTFIFVISNKLAWIFCLVLFMRKYLASDVVGMK